MMISNEQYNAGPNADQREDYREMMQSYRAVSSALKALPYNDALAGMKHLDDLLNQLWPWGEHDVICEQCMTPLWHGVDDENGFLVACGDIDLCNDCASKYTDAQDTQTP